MSRSRSPMLVAFIVLGLVSTILNSGPLQAQEKKKLPVKLRIIVPQEDAELYFSSKITKQEGVEREFESSPLEPGSGYYYDMKVIWEPNNYTHITRYKRIDVEPGKSYTVDFTKPNPKRPDDIKVRYVPTPTEVVDEMLKLGKVQKGDVVFDLGCGDGRFVIDAVRNYGAKRGVGVDIDPDRIRDSLNNAKKYKVTDKVVFREGDVLKKVDDLQDADVVMLYMGEDINLRLRPVLKAKLKPGARVVSHRFLMGDWMPDKSITVKDAEGTEYELHLWTIGGKEAKKEEKKDEPKKDEKKKDENKEKAKESTLLTPMPELLRSALTMRAMLPREVALLARRG